jgi:hypothetical protein
MNSRVPLAPTNTGLIESCRKQALDLLRRNLTPHGISAASVDPASGNRQYHCVFGRDASICALAMAISGDQLLLEGALNSLRTLATHQAGNGQIPKYVDAQRDEGDFWYLGCIDATLWWLVALDFLDSHAGTQLRNDMSTNVERALHWLYCQEHPRLHLLQQNEASDWADIMPRSGFVLYSNALWYRIKRRYGLAQARETRHHFNHLFHPYTRDLPEYRRLRLLMHYARQNVHHRELYLSFINFSFFGDEGDVLGNLLAILFGLAGNVHANRIVRALKQAHADQPYPMRAVLDPIRRDDPLWRPYMARHHQNIEYQYHNGGVWPFIGGFWAMVLMALGMQSEADQALEQFAEASRINDWQFNEWLHGESGDARGMSGQSWNAAMFLLALHARSGKIF